jgi:hypothetical protein
MKLFRIFINILGKENVDQGELLKERLFIDVISFIMAH